MQLLINIPAKAMRYQYLAIKGLCITQKKSPPPIIRARVIGRAFRIELNLNNSDLSVEARCECCHVGIHPTQCFREGFSGKAEHCNFFDV